MTLTVLVPDRVRVRPWDDPQQFGLSVNLPLGATLADLRDAQGRLRALQEEDATACPYCPATPERVHRLDCPNMPDGSYASMHAAMEALLAERP